MVLKSAAAMAAVLGVWSQVSIINLPFLQVTYSRITLTYSHITWAMQQSCLLVFVGHWNYCSVCFARDYVILLLFRMLLTACPLHQTLSKIKNDQEIVETDLTSLCVVSFFGGLH